MLKKETFTKVIAWYLAIHYEDMPFLQETEDK
jgi:hypothetical protein